MKNCEYYIKLDGTKLDSYDALLKYIDDKTILKNNIYKYYSDKEKYPDLYLI